MDFTELYKQSSLLSVFSPSSEHILTATNDRLIIRLAATLQIIQAWAMDVAPSPSASTLAKLKAGSRASPKGVSHIGWSNNGEYVMACLADRGVVEVRCTRDEEWSARIEAGVEGLVRGEWAPDGHHVLCWSEMGLRLTIHSLVTGQSIGIPHPTHSDRAYAFRSDGRYLVLATRRGGKDMLNIHDAADSYALVRHCTLPTSSIADLSLSPDGQYIAVWESVLEYKLHIITIDGRLQHSFAPSSTSPESGLGVRAVSWHPTSGFLAVGGWDEQIYLLAKLADWRSVATLDITTKLTAGCGANVWREPLGWLEATLHRGFVQYSPAHLPLSILDVKADPSRVPLRRGPLQLAWSPSGQYLLVRSESMPTALHIFSLPPPTLPFSPRLHSVLLHESRITTARWNPARDHGCYLIAAACEGKGAVYLWGDEAEWETEDDGAERLEGVADCCGVPAKKFETKDVGWSPDGKSLILFDRDTFCCAFEIPADS